MKSFKNLKSGNLVEITWLDACFYNDSVDISEDAYKRGGETLFLVGWVYAKNENCVIICGELNEKRGANRDFNLIPLSLITNVKRKK